MIKKKSPSVLIQEVRKEISFGFGDLRDVSYIKALRATGNNHAFLGYRDGSVFQVLFIEYKFGDIYNH